MTKPPIDMANSSMTRRIDVWYIQIIRFVVRWFDPSPTCSHTLCKLLQRLAAEGRAKQL